MHDQTCLGTASWHAEHCPTLCQDDNSSQASSLSTSTTKAAKAGSCSLISEQLLLWLDCIYSTCARSPTHSIVLQAPVARALDREVAYHDVLDLGSLPRYWRKATVTDATTKAKAAKVSKALQLGHVDTW